MHARVATFENDDPDQVRKMAAEISKRGESGPPEGVPAIGFLMLHQADSGKALAITLFETEEDLQKGHETLSSMAPPIAGGMGERTSVELYEVGAKFDA